MKKAEVEKLVGKSIMVTTILLGIMLIMKIVEDNILNPLNYTVASTAVVVISIVFAIIAVGMVVLSILKNREYYVFATISAISAIIFMLLKVDHNVISIGFKIGVRTVKFYYIALAILALSVLVVWIRATIKLIKN